MDAADVTIKKGKRKPSRRPMDYARQRLNNDDARHAAMDAERAKAKAAESGDAAGVNEEMLDRVDAGEEPKGIVNGGDVKIGNTPVAPQILLVDLDKLHPTALNPRFRVDMDRVKEIASTMNVPAISQLQYPITRKRAAGGYELLTGRHRYEAAKFNKWDAMLVHVRELSDADAAKVVTLDNMQRADLHPLEEAIGIDNMIKAGWSVAGIASNIRKPEAWVARRHSLVKLSAKWQDAIRNPAQFDTNEKHFSARNYVGRLSASHYELVARLPEHVQEDKFELMRQWFHGAMHVTEHMEHRLRDGDRRLDDAKFLPEDAEITRRLGDVSTCATCPKQTGAAPLLFDDEPGQSSKKRKGGASDQCLDGVCWERKEAIFVQIRIEQAKEKHGEVLAVQTEHRNLPKPVARAAKKASGEAIVNTSTNPQASVASKGDRGARPAVVTSGPNIGQTVYVKVTKPKAAAGSASDKQPKPSLETDRRLHIVNAVNNQLLDAINNKKLAGNDLPTESDLTILAALSFSGRWGPRIVQAADMLKRIIKRKWTINDVEVWLLREVAERLKCENVIEELLTAGDDVTRQFLDMLMPLPGEWDLDSLRAAAIEAHPDPEDKPAAGESATEKPARKPAKKTAKTSSKKKATKKTRRKSK